MSATVNIFTAVKKYKTLHDLTEMIQNDFFFF